MLMVSMLAAAGLGTCKPGRQPAALMIGKSDWLSPDDGRWMDPPSAPDAGGVCSSVLMIPDAGCRERSYQAAWIAERVDLPGAGHSARIPGFGQPQHPVEFRCALRVPSQPCVTAAALGPRLV